MAQLASVMSRISPTVLSLFQLEGCSVLPFAGEVQRYNVIQLLLGEVAKLPKRVTASSPSDSILLNCSGIVSLCFAANLPLASWQEASTDPEDLHGFKLRLLSLPGAVGALRR